MRNVGTCERRDLAQRFSSYLLSVGIGNEVREGRGRWDVWVYVEEEVAKAEEEFGRFTRQSDDPRYRVEAKIETLRRQAPPKPVPRAGEVPTRLVRGRAPATVALIGISVIVYILSETGAAPALAAWLYCQPALIMEGQVWRLITPIFMHANTLHIVFNMLMLYQLGGAVETGKGALFYVGMALAVAAVSNLAQALLVGPSFCGISGVVYGLFGYVWMKSRFEPFDGMLLDDFTIMLMLFWFLLGVTGLVGHMANWAHGVGLAAGMAFGVWPTAWQSLTRKKGGI